MAEFEEILLSGGMITLKKLPQGGVAINFCQRNSFPAAVFLVCVSYEGRLLGTAPIGGMGQTIPCPQSSMPALLISDRHGMFGRHCPWCKSYFRTDACPGDRVCPYCGHIGQNIDFTTDNQIKYIEVLCNAFQRASTSADEVTLNLDEFAEQLPNNRPGWLYAEEQQQNSYTCSNCSVKFDVLGEYALCPGCGKANASSVFNSKINALQTEFGQADANIHDRHEREVQWEKLTRCVSEFEALANELRRLLLRLPATPQHKVALGNQSFQNIIAANDRFCKWFDFEILGGISEEDRKFLHVMFQRRHVFTHRAGRVDQEYLDNSGDTTVRLNQMLRLHSKEIRRLIPLIGRCGENLIRGCESIG